ncbi:MAG TPA: hypothetical protein VK191_11645 [Symbiobacteriaceae bacterium]|nr:hypothetical protein [Symbiobacteriaceae bacterium]
MHLTGREAWHTGFRTLRHHPWLALLPLAADLLSLCLAWLGIPLGPVVDLPRLLDTDYGFWLTPQAAPPTGQTISFTGFIPHALPSLTDLHLSLQPARLTLPVGLPLWRVLTAQLLIPALGALLTALYLGLIADGVRGELRAGSWRQALRAFPGLFAVLLLWRFALSLFGIPGLIVLTGGALLVPLLQIALGAGGHPLFVALLEGASRFWGRLGAWLGLGLLTMLSTGLFTLLWSLAGRLPWLALLTYPFLATPLVAGAVALFLSPEVVPTTAMPVKRFPRLWIPLLALLGALGGARLMHEWAGYAATPEAAIRTWTASSRGANATDGTILQRERQGDLEWDLIRTNAGELVLAELQVNRFGWKPRTQVHGGRWGAGVQPRTAWVHVSGPSISPADRGRPAAVIWGELTDQQVAALQVDDAVIPVGQHGSAFLLLSPREPQSIYTLDSTGQRLVKVWSR